MNLDELAKHAAFELAGMHPDDQGAALAAACETLAGQLRAERPWLTDPEVQRACLELAQRVRARLHNTKLQSDGARLP